MSPCKQSYNKTRSLLRCLGLVVFLLFVQSSYSQDQLISLKTGNIYDSKKDNQGRVWFATSYGLVLHDGANSIKVTTNNTEYDAQEVQKIVIYKNNLYTIYKDHGVFKFNLDNLGSNLVTNKKVSSVAQLNDSTFYVLYSSGILEKRQKENVKVLRHFDKDFDNTSLLFEGPAQSLLICIPNYGLYRVNAKSGIIEKDYGIKPNGFLSFFAKLNGRIFFNSKSVLLELDSSDNFVKSKIIREKDNFDISAVDIISEHEILYVKLSKRIFLINNDSLINIETPKNKTYQVSSVLLGDINNLYIGTNQGLVKIINTYRTTRQIFDSVAELSNLTRIRRKIINYSKNEILFLGHPNSYIYNLKSGSFKPILKKPNPLYDGEIIEDNLWASSEGGGIYKVNLKDGRTDSIITKGIDPKKLYLSVVNISPIQSNSLALGTRGKVLLYNFKTNKVDSVLFNNYNARVRSIAIDTISKMLYAGTEDGLYLINLENSKLAGKLDCKGKLISDIKIDNYNGRRSLWIASDFGLENFDLKSKKVVDKYNLDEFNNSKLASILFDSLHRIWLSSFTGVYAVDPHKRTIIKINNERKLANMEFNYKSATKLLDGNLIFGGLNGYDIIDPKYYNFNHNNSKGIITGYSIYSIQDTLFSPYINKSKILFNTDNSFIRIYFTINNSEIIRYCTFEYSIDNGSWVPIQDATNFILYKLQDGLHTIKIRGVDEVGNNISFNPILIDYYTNFFKSSTFVYLLLFFVIVLIWFIIIFRIKSYQNEKKIKDDIAMDLHDEVGTILTRTLYTLKNDKDNSPIKEVVTNYISEALFGIRAYINAINQNNVSINQIVDEIKEFRETFFKNYKIEYHLHFDIDADYQVDSNVYRELKMLLYEINQNVIKHSKATEKTTYFWIKNGLLNVQTYDNGPLTDADEILSKGNGINNIKKRINRLNGAVDFLISDLGHGLQINIKIRI